MGTTTSKTTFTVPVLANSDGTFTLWPFFHRPPVFTAGGYDWSISYYPNSLYDSDSIDLCLQLESKGSKVTISSSVDLLDPTAALPPLNLVKPSPPFSLDSDDDDRRTLTHWVRKSVLRQAPGHGYLPPQANLLFEWTIAVTPETATPMALPEPVPEAELIPIPIPEPKPMLPATDAVPIAMPELDPEAIPEPKLPATDVAPMPMPTPKLPAMTEVAPVAKVPATDVTYSVGGELFHAHKAILSTQSPVFKAEVSKAMTTASEAPAIVEVDGMRPDVFEALLSYIYTDALPLPATEDEGRSDEDATSQMMCDLLVAADRYDLERLKLLCEGKLSEIVDVDNVAEMLAFADDHYCCVLEDACIKFMVNSGRMKEVVESPGYQRLRSKHPLILVDVLEKFSINRNVYD